MCAKVTDDGTANLNEFEYDFTRMCLISGLKTI